MFEDRPEDRQDRIDSLKEQIAALQAELAAAEAEAVEAPVSGEPIDVESIAVGPGVESVIAPAAAPAASAAPASVAPAAVAPASAAEPSPASPIEAPVQTYAQPMGQQAYSTGPQPAYKQPYNSGPVYTPGAAYSGPYQRSNYAQGGGIPRSKDHVAAALLAIFLGMLGLHKFYLGYNPQGFIMLGCSVVGGLLSLGMVTLLMLLISIVEGIIYMTKSQYEFDQIYVMGRRAWF